MKVCLVSQQYPPETAVGGIGSQTALKARGLAARGHAVHVLSSTNELVEREERDGEVTVHRIPHPGATTRYDETAVTWLGYSWRVAEKLTNLHAAVGFDIVEFPEYGAEGFVFQLESAAQREVPVVVMLHGSLRMFAELIGWPERDSEFCRVGCFMEETSIRLADRVLAASGNIAEFWCRRLGDAVNPSVVFTGVDADAFSSHGERGGRRPTVLFVGRIDEAKGAFAVADAVLELRGRHPEILARFVGGMTPTVRARLTDAILHAGAAEHFDLVGRVPNGDLPPYYAECDVFAMPAPEEHGLATVFLEAMASGKPVVASRSAGAPEAVIDGETGLLVEPHAHEELVRALDMLLSDCALAQRLGASGRKRVLERFTADHLVDRIEAQYRLAIDSFRRSAESVIS